MSSNLSLAKLDTIAKQKPHVSTNKTKYKLRICLCVRVGVYVSAYVCVFGVCMFNNL